MHFTLLYLLLSLVGAAQAGTYCSRAEPFCVSGTTTDSRAEFTLVAPPGAANGWVAIGMGADSMPGSEIFVVSLLG